MKGSKEIYINMGSPIIGRTMEASAEVFEQYHRDLFSKEDRVGGNSSSDGFSLLAVCLSRHVLLVQVD